ncbi:MAG: hypothetical protein ABEJ87_04860 [Candidatus Nanohalobium sp.]
MGVAYRDDGEFDPFVNEKVGDCSTVARDYAELMYGEEKVERYRLEVDEVIEEYSNPFSGELSRPDFFEKVKPEIDELLSE